MTLRSEIINFIRQNLLHESQQAPAIGHVPVVKEESLIGDVRILIKMIHPVCVDHRCPALQTMHLVSLLQKKIGEVRAVLSSDTCDECTLHTLLQFVWTAQRCV